MRVMALGLGIFITAWITACGGGGGGGGGGDNGSPPPTTPQGKGILSVPNAGAHAILFFDHASTASGDIAPNRILTGTATGLRTPVDLVVDTAHDRLYVANQEGNAVLVFDEASKLSGNVPPTRTITVPFPMSLALDMTRDLLYVAIGESPTIIDLGLRQSTTIGVFDHASVLSGTVGPHRTIRSLGAELHNIKDLIVDQEHDRVIVGQQGFLYGMQTLSIFDHASTISGSVIPSRSLTPTLATPYPGSVIGLALDVSRDLLFLAGGLGVEVYSHASMTDGTLSPTRTFGDNLDPIESALIGSSGAFLDAEADRLYVVGAIPPAALSEDLPHRIYILDHASTLSGTLGTHRTIGGSRSTFKFPDPSVSATGLFVDTTR